MEDEKKCVECKCSAEDATCTNKGEQCCKDEEMSEKKCEDCNEKDDGCKC